MAQPVPRCSRKPSAVRTARIALLRPHAGATVDFEAGYVRHLEWHRQAKDTFVWYGWTVWAGERQRWFVYATFGQTAASLNSPVAPADDERDNILNVTPHAEFVENAVYEYLPALSRGAGVPQPTPRLELVTVELKTGAAKAFETAISTGRSSTQGDSLWYRMVAGGTVPVMSASARGRTSRPFSMRATRGPPGKVDHLIGKVTVEILNLRPTMSYGLVFDRQ